MSTNTVVESKVRFPALLFAFPDLILHTIAVGQEYGLKVGQKIGPIPLLVACISIPEEDVIL